MKAYAPRNLNVFAALIAFALGFLAVGTAAAKEKISIKPGSLTLNANLELADGKQLSDGAILITHGTLAHNEMEIIKTMQTLLSERGHNSLAINLSLGLDNRGSAMYDCPVPHKHLYLDAVDEIAAWINWLKSKGTTSISVLGHSRGGAQTARYAAQKPDATVKNVVLIAPATWSQKDSEGYYKKNFKTDLGPLLERAQKLASNGKGAQMIENIGILYCGGTSATADAFVSYNKPDPRRHTPNLLKDIKLPTLVIAGSSDTIVKDLPKAVKPLADGKKLQFKVIDDADHFFRDFAGEELADLIVDFIKQ